MAELKVIGTVKSMYIGCQNLTASEVLHKLSSHPNKPDALFLPINCIDDEGIQMILTSPKLSAVYYLDLYHNQIADRGALAVIQSSKTNSISSLNLSQNHISANGIVALAENLPGSKIVCLDLRFNPGSKSPQALKALKSAASKHKILQYLQIEGSSCIRSELLPVLKNNREYVSQIQKELKDVIVFVTNLELHYPMDILDLNTLKKCEQFFYNKMVISNVDGADKVTVTKIQNYINDNFFKNTGIVSKGLTAKRIKSASLAVLPPEILSNITKYCKISDFYYVFSKKLQIHQRLKWVTKLEKKTLKK